MTSHRQDAGGTDERRDERLDRELGELLEETRVAMPGVQVLFGFLLTVPFQRSFERLEPYQRTTYLVALIGAAAAAACFMAPTTFHRIRFRQRDKEALVRYGTKTLIAGSVCLAVAMCAAVFTVVDWLFRSTTVALVVGPVAALYLVLWFGVPLMRRLSREPEPT